MSRNGQNDDGTRSRGPDQVHVPEARRSAARSDVHRWWSQVSILEKYFIKYLCNLFQYLASFLLFIILWNIAKFISLKLVISFQRCRIRNSSNYADIVRNYCFLETSKIQPILKGNTRFLKVWFYFLKSYENANNSPNNLQNLLFSWNIHET